ncbi:succinate dehydrogenase assembly factor 4, mitochondrial isoform X2 [Sebastes umbrosus]|uniref:succinate dehydrogenase assembly factor 4, mitochondrial isoform X2 n=2 Tax=Sebastes TaxID=34820 RepID=UPI0018A0CD9C|nr:succinate dehydrogenase assembly factor 4, mitochondrial isoform X2 [Sebastes umbrosus]
MMTFASLKRDGQQQQHSVLCKCPSSENIIIKTFISYTEDMSLLRFCSTVNRHVVSKSLSVESVFTGCSRAASGAVKDKEPLKKAKTPQGRFDTPEEASKAALQKYPDDVNPATKEKGGPRGPEPTRYGDWERKGRCVDF